VSRRSLLAVPVLAAAAARARSGDEALPSAPVNAGPEDEAKYWRLVKAQFLVDPGVTYLNAGTCGLQSRETAAVEAAIRTEMAANFSRYFVERLIDRRFRDLCQHVATALGADIDGISFTSGATEAMNFIANGMDLAAGDEVLTTSHEHQAGIYPWLLLARRRGIRVRQLPWPAPPAGASDIVERFARELTARTRVVSFCHVQYTDGTVLPVREICALARQHGAISVVDGAQSVGMLDFGIADLGCDFFATSLHKWLGAPYGTGLMWVHPSHRDRLWPTVVESYDGWDAADRYGAVTGKPGLDFVEHWPAAMVKYGTNVHYYGSVFWAVQPALRLHEAIGRAQVERRVLALAGRLREGLSRIGGVEVLTPAAPGLSAGLIAFKVHGADARTLARAISREDRLTVRSVIHEGIGYAALRACTHIFNDEDDVDRLVAAVARRVRA
jgi:selenocysteine lyase/cysteine desulfurase